MAMNVNVWSARKDKKLTQPQLADKVGVGKVDIIRIETAGWIPPKDVRAKLAKTLGRSEDVLFGHDVAALSV